MTPQLDLRFCSINVFGLKFNPYSHFPAEDGLEIASIACFKLGPSWTIIEFLHGDKPEADNDKVEVVENKKITMPKNGIIGLEGDKKVLNLRKGGDLKSVNTLTIQKHCIYVSIRPDSSGS